MHEDDKPGETKQNFLLDETTKMMTVTKQTTKEIREIVESRRNQTKASQEVPTEIQQLAPPDGNAK